MQANEPGAGVELDKMPMPMDSAEGLQEFAVANGVLNINENSDQDSAIGNNNPGDPAAVSNTNTIKEEGWYQKYCRWVPTSPFLLEQAEKKVLSYVKTGHQGRFVDIGEVGSKSKCKWSFCQKPEERKVWTLEFNKDADKTPLVMVHGLCAAVGLWSLNIDSLAANRPLYAIDLIGFGRSSRPTFSTDPVEAETQHVEAIEAWRKAMGLERFILLGHSMGGFISSAYALKYPDRVVHLVLADPWGYPKKPDELDGLVPPHLQNSFKFKALTTIGQMVNPLAALRAAGPMGPGLIGKMRPDLVLKFQPLNQNGSASVGEYIYHCNAQRPTGEEAFRTMMDFFGWAKNPMCNRIHELKPEMPLTMIYGGHTWLPQLPEETIKELRPGAQTEVHTIEKAGHHVYVDDQNLFNSIVNKAASIADKLFPLNRVAVS